MYSEYDYHDMAREVRENLARIYAESFQEQEYVDPDAQNDTYNKIQTILKCPEMEKCHPFLYSLDMEHVNETDTEKINRIYNLGKERGIIREDDDEDSQGDGFITKECDGEDGDGCEDGLCGGPSDSLTDQPLENNPLEQIPMDLPDSRKPIYTVLYSGMKDGDLKVGEFYSMGTNTEGAKEECIRGLTQQGYSGITVMAVEQTPPSYGTSFASQDTEGSENDDVSTQDVYNEDDSEEYLRQETGDTSDGKEEDSEAEKTDVTDGDSAEQTKEETPSEDSVEKEPEAEETEKKEEEEDSTEKADSKEEEKKSEDEPEEDSSEGTDAEKTEDAEDSEPEEEEKKVEDEPKKLTPDEKVALREEYTRTFKDVLKKTGFDISVSEMNMKQRTEFYQKMSEKWTKNDPSDFLDDKEQEKLNKTVVKAD